MRIRTTLSAILLATATLFAQTGMDQALKEQAAASGLKVEDDNDPFTPNTFIGSFTLEIQPWEAGKPATTAPMLVHLWNSADKTLMSVATGQANPMRMLTDLQGKWTYLLMVDAKGTRTAMKTRKKKVSYSGKDMDTDTKITTTDETRTIEGHLCTKVMGTSTDGAWTAWVTKDLNLDLGSLMGGMAGSGKDAAAWKDIKGFPMEMETRDTSGKTTSVMRIKEVSQAPVDPSMFSLDGYAVMEIPGLGR